MAEDLYIRTWANAMDSHRILWLIKEKVPLFIIHSLTDHEQNVPAIHALPLSQGFVKHSKAEQLDATRNGDNSQPGNSNKTLI
jgi:hypothetical protein